MKLKMMETCGQSGVLLGSSAAVERLRLQVERFAPHFRTVLLVGEPGTGKESVGRELHRLSPLAGEAFAAMSVEDFVKLEQGCGRVIYLRGLGEAHADVQDGLVRRLARLGRETRLIVACEGEPRGMVAAGRLRAEVLERVGMLEIRVAPLRERLEDLPVLTGAMLDELGCAARWGEAEFAVVRGYGWPGNLAELRRLCKEFAATGVVRLETETVKPGPEVVRLEEVIERHVMRVLEGCAGNKLKAAEMLGISRSTLYRMLEASGSAAGAV